MVYELIDGKPVYYKGYKDVINLEKQIDDVIPITLLQAIIISLITEYLFDNLDNKKYKYFIGSPGPQLNEHDHLVADFAIFQKDMFYNRKITNEYISIPPKIIFKIDTKADLNNFDNIMEYYQVKTNKLFKFGVEKVFWILTKNKQIIEAIPNDNWLVKDWDKEIFVIENISFSIDQLLKEDGIYDLVY